MKALLIGGSGFIGPFVARGLLREGHEVAVFHRGQAAPELPPGALRILGDRNQLAAHAAEISRWAPEVVVDLILSSGRQADALMDLFRGATGRVVALSSQDVYRAFGILLGLEPGPPQPVPLTEESELRTRLHPYGPEQTRRMQAVFSWLDEDYDKIPVERAVLGDPRLPGTVLRLPMIYGPGDPLHRFFPLLARMDGGRPAILLQEEAARLHPPRGYVENVAAAIVLAATAPAAAGHVYNVVEPYGFSELDWAREISAAAGWSGQVLALPRERTPPHLQVPFAADQDWPVSGERIRRELGFVEPVPLPEALRRTIDWERAHPPAQVDSAQFGYAARAAEDAALAGLPAPTRPAS
jgi:nucleoside-diphosphate-sugar epimerase